MLPSSVELRVWPSPWNSTTAGQPPAGGVPVGSKKLSAIWTPSLIVTNPSVFVNESPRAPGAQSRAAANAAVSALRSTAHRLPTGRRPYNRPMPPRAASDSRPIGVFDSGVGGLTVLHECLVTMPHEDFVYLGDHARLPYGQRPLPEIRRFAHEIGAFLEAQDVKLVLVACNAATSAALPQLQEEPSGPGVGLITPEAHAAVQATRNRRV